MQFLPAKNCFKQRISRRYRTDVCDKIFNSDTELSATRSGLTRSTSARIRRNVFPSSTSDA